MDGRAHAPDMKPLRVLLVSPNTERMNSPAPPLGLAFVAAATRRAGHEVRFLDLFGKDDPGAALAAAIDDFGPEAIGLSARNVDDQSMEAPVFLLDAVREAVALCRARSRAPIVVGGAGFSIFPRAALAYLGADYGIVGEGEDAFPALLARLAAGADPAGVPGLVSATDAPGAAPAPAAADLADLPSPAEEAWLGLDPEDRELWFPVQSRRGCPLDCSYCATSAIEGRRIRRRPPARVADEIARIAGAGFRRIWIVDNTFNLPAAHALELCREIEARKTGVVWRAIVYPSPLPEALVAAMAAAGCVGVSLGFESGAPAVLERMNKRYGPDDVRRAVALLRKHGIAPWGFLLLGGPGETPETARASLGFADSLDLAGRKVTVGIRIYPGTALHRTAVEEGVVAPDDDLLAPRFYCRPGLVGAILPTGAR